MLQCEHSAIRLPFIKLPSVIKDFVLSIFEWPFLKYTGFTVYEPAYEALFIACAQKPLMNANADVLVLIYIHTLCMFAAKVQACRTDSSEPSLPDTAIPKSHVLVHLVKCHKKGYVC